eukprot:990258-Amphidinium_carterae.1
MEISMFMEQRDGGNYDWVLVLDCAPVHCSREFVDAVSTYFPMCHLVFVQAGTTSFNQPLDIAFMRSFKGQIQKAAGMNLAKDIAQGVSDLGEVKTRPELKLDLLSSGCPDVFADQH